MDYQDQSSLQAESSANGRTIISESAVAKVAGIAARAVPGVHSLGSGSSRALGAIRDAVGSSDHAAGVRAEVGETQVAVDINLVAIYGHPLRQVAEKVREAVYTAVEQLVGLQVIEVNIEINDVYLAPTSKQAPGTSGAAGTTGTTGQVGAEQPAREALR